MKTTIIITYLVFILAGSMISLVTASLTVGFYESTCPSAESVVRKAVNKVVSQNPGIAAGLIRMHFHDCFVKGCDASILLDSTPENPSEKEHPANNPSLRGFEVIYEAKAKIESLCPQVVSCADIIAFAARDSAYKVGGIKYAVPSGRRDGCVSRIDDVPQNLPALTFNSKQLEDNFAKKGLSLDEMVTLSGAHSIGVSHCSSFSTRLYSFNSTHPQDPAMDRRYAAYLKTRCPKPSTNNEASEDPSLSLDSVTPDRLDNTYYKELKKHRGLLASDQTLFDSLSTTGMVRNNLLRPSSWAAKFASAMIHMGSIDVKTGNHGEIRKNCQFVN